MTDALDPASLVEAAQKAVGDGDYVAAERLLREAAAVQEATLGASHADLASTLNNLAFVCERTDNFDEAERGYRRAHAIAVASLSPGHPLIATSLKNLVEFCAAHEIPIWKPPPAGPEDEAPLLDADDEESVEFADELPEIAIAPDDREEPVSVTNRLTPRTIAVAALAVVAIIVVLLARQGTTESPAPSPGPSPGASPAPSLGASPAPSPGPSPGPSPASSSGPTVAPSAGREAAVTVLTARLCSGLEKQGSPDWQCAPTDGELRPGTYFYYTRLLANAGTTVEHRWYRSERVHQVMRLRVAANPGSGYRTFSSNTVSPERAGDWKVELRAADGSVLHEERFVVR